MKTLEEIFEFAKNNDACNTQFLPFQSAIVDGNELLAWQIVLGNVKWLRFKGLGIEQLELEENAKNIGKCYCEGNPFPSEVTYVNGNKEGINKYYHLDGSIYCEINYVGGLKNGRFISYYSSGVPSEVCTYLDNRIHGKNNLYYLDGKLWVDRNFVNGKEDGRYRIWYNNGQISKDCTFLNGRLYGEYRIWYENGQLMKRSTYFQNVEVSKENYLPDGTVMYD